jgi:glycosyltransferase involved in cell wall biosynthesis
MTSKEGSSALPLVTIVVATNRGGLYLAEALESVGAQTYPYWELVVVDDGSADPEAIARLVDDSSAAGRARLVRVPPGGVSEARNRGVEAGSGTILAFLDDDDRWNPRRLELGVAPFSDPAVVVTYCGMRTIDAEGHELVPAGQSPVAGRSEIVAGKGALFAGNVLVRREAFEAGGGFDSRFRAAEDLDLVLTLASIGPFGYVAPTLVDYRVHDANTTGGYRDLACAIRVILREHRDRARLAGDETILRALARRNDTNDRFAAWAAARAARVSWRMGAKGPAAADLAWAARFAPRAPWLWLHRRMRG